MPNSGCDESGAGLFGASCQMCGAHRDDPCDCFDPQGDTGRIRMTDAEYEYGKNRLGLGVPLDVPERNADDNTLALGQAIQRLERVRLGWFLSHDPEKHTAEFRYEFRVFDGPARGIYRGSTATMAATGALAALDEHQVGWPPKFSSADECPDASAHTPDWEDEKSATHTPKRCQTCGFWAIWEEL